MSLQLTLKENEEFILAHWMKIPSLEKIAKTSA
jgi:hypothetical protein